jgi:hypothetical protein
MGGGAGVPGAFDMGSLQNLLNVRGQWRRLGWL